MADLINPRLLARVERSLHKRLNSDVMPHLLRCAARARSEDEFIAAAARLILNAQERQHWLASWATRRHVEGGDTGPGTFDSTIPGALDSQSQRSFRISPAKRERLREALARELGPIAELLLDNESERSDSVSELLTRLEAHLEGEEQRMRFRNSTSSKFQSEA